MKLKAKTAILYQNRLYEAGDELPQHEPAMVQAWLEAGTAVREDSEVSTDTTPGQTNATTAKPKASRSAKGTASK